MERDPLNFQPYASNFKLLFFIKATLKKKSCFLSSDRVTILLQNGIFFFFILPFFFFGQNCLWSNHFLTKKLQKNNGNKLVLRVA